jgi:hypothetical protein
MADHIHWDPKSFGTNASNKAIHCSIMHLVLHVYQNVVKQLVNIERKSFDIPD